VSAVAPIGPILAAILVLAAGIARPARRRRPFAAAVLISLSASSVNLAVGALVLARPRAALVLAGAAGVCAGLAVHLLGGPEPDADDDDDGPEPDAPAPQGPVDWERFDAARRAWAHPGRVSPPIGASTSPE
jgi:hypothetical protein